MLDTWTDTAQGPASNSSEEREWLRSLGRGARYLAIRSIAILLTVLIGIYAAIWVVNWGGASDADRKEEIRYGVLMGFGASGFWSRADLTAAEMYAAVDTFIEDGWRNADLYEPFAIRSLRYFREACTLTLGDSLTRNTRTGSTRVRDILLESVPMTLLLFGVANLIVFFGALFIGLALSRRYGTGLDKLATLSIPVLTAPPWFHGLILIAVFASILKVLPFGGMMSPPIPATAFGYILGVLKHMILPVTAIVLGTMPFAVYANRALFLIHSDDDYVELAKAKGLSSRRIALNYILRPTLPPIITNFVFIAIVAWEGVIITENVFNWPGLGGLFLGAVNSFDVSLVTGGVVIFAYLIALNVLLLDVIYVLVDPRISLSSGGKS